MEGTHEPMMPPLIIINLAQDQVATDLDVDTSEDKKEDVVLYKHCISVNKKCNSKLLC